VNERTGTSAEFAAWRGRYVVPPGVDIVVNATSVGMFPDVDARLDLDVKSLRPGQVVADVIVNPPRTSLIRDAEAEGCVALDGLGMVVNQAVIGIKYWTGSDVDARIMRARLQELFHA
jgi:shikimate dehydrogenase